MKKFVARTNSVVSGYFMYEENQNYIFYYVMSLEFRNEKLYKEKKRQLHNKYFRICDKHMTSSHRPKTRN